MEYLKTDIIPNEFKFEYATWPHARKLYFESIGISEKDTIVLNNGKEIFFVDGVQITVPEFYPPNTKVKRNKYKVRTVRYDRVCEICEREYKARSIQSKMCELCREMLH